MTTAYLAHFFGKPYDRVVEDLHLAMAPEDRKREPKSSAANRHTLPEPFRGTRVYS